MTDSTIPARLWQTEPGGIVFAVRATPRASRNAIVGIVALADGRPALSVRIAAPPAEGEANAALIAVLAEALAVRKRDIVIASGETGRVKRIRVRGEATALTDRIKALVRCDDHDR